LVQAEKDKNENLENYIKENNILKIENTKKHKFWTLCFFFMNENKN